MTSIIDRIEVDHARFNALKTFSTNEPSLFEQTRFGDLIATRDPARPDSYYNRVLGLTADNAALLDQAMAWILGAARPGQRIRIDVNADTARLMQLVDRGFELVDALVWLRFDTDATRSGIGEGDCRSLTVHDRPELRRLLHAHGHIPDKIWQMKRMYLCTETFRWVGVFDHHQLVSAASTWVTTDAVVLGSAYTRPHWRGRGYQQQLLEARVRAAGAAAYVDVAPGSTSYRNCKRGGFEDFEHRQIWEFHAPARLGI